MVLQTQFDFQLPKGYVDDNGTIHREGTMRMATALDEIAPLSDPRVRQNDAYLIIILLSRVVTRLGTLPKITPNIIEQLFAADIAYLQDLYRRINELDSARLTVTCPSCGEEFEVEVPLLGE